MRRALDKAGTAGERRSGWLPWHVGTAFAIAIAVTPGLAHGAASEGPIIVIKSRVGAPPAGADSMTSLINDEFEAEGFAARLPTVERILGGRLPRPGILDAGVSAAELMHPVELGYDDWAHGLFEEAENTLVPALRRLHRNAALLVTDTKNLETIFRGYAALALSQDRLGETEKALATMTDLIRIFRSRPPARSEFGPPGEHLYHLAYRPLQAAGTGSLFVTTGNIHAMIYVDNQIRGIGKAEVADLIPGIHRVLIQVPSTPGLQYVVNVKANQDANLDVDWDVETSLSVTDPWIGFAFANEAERNKEAAFAGALARRWGSRGVVAVVTTYEIQGQPVLIGTLYRAGGAMLRSAATTLDGDLAEQIRSLARYLADGTMSPGVKVIAQPKEASSVLASSSPRSTNSPLPGLLVTGAGALAVSAAGLVYVTSKADDYTQPTYDDKRTPAVGVMSGGSVVLGAGVYLYLRESRSCGTLASASLGAGVAAIVSGTALYVTREGLHNEGWQRPTYRPTGGLGATLGVSGMVLTGIGLWLWHREGSESAMPVWVEPGTRRKVARSAPVVSVDRSQALVEWAGSF